MSEEVGRVTAIIDADLSQLNAAMNQAKNLSTAGVAGIEGSIKSKLGAGIAGAFGGGNWLQIGRDTADRIVSGMTAGLGQLGAVVEGIAKMFGPEGIIVAAAIAGTAVLVKQATEVARAWESAMVQVAKTSELVVGSAEYKQVEAGLKDVMKESLKMEEILSAGALAGSMGIATEEISDFVREALHVSVAFDMDTESATTGLSKMRSQIKEVGYEGETAAEFVRKVGSAIDHMGNITTAREYEIVEFATRATGSLSLLGATRYDIVGLGAALISVFPSAQRASGSLESLINQLTGTTASSLEAQDLAANLIGMSPEEFQVAINTNVTDTILRIIEAIEKLDEIDQARVAGIIGGSYGDDVLKKGLGHAANWRELLAEAKESGEEATSIGESYAAAASSSEAGIQRLSNAFKLMLIDIGGPINDVINALTGPLADGLNKIREIGEQLYEPLSASLGVYKELLDVVSRPSRMLIGASLDSALASARLLNQALEMATRYGEAFYEVVVERLAGSSAWQTITAGITGMVDSLYHAFEFIADIVSKVVSGLADAIPTAITGAIGALGGLAEKAGLGSVLDAIGAVTGFFGDFIGEVNAKAAGKALGDEISAGLNESLKNAVGDAALGEEARKHIQSEGKKARSELEAIMEGFGISGPEALEIINRQAAESKGYGGLFGRGSGSRIVREQGIEFRIDYRATSTATDVALYVDGQLMAEGSGFGSQEVAIATLFDRAGVVLSPETSLLLQNRPGEAAKLKLTQEVEPTFEIKSLAAKFYGRGGEKDELAQKVADAFDEALKTIDWEHLPGVIDSAEDLKKAIHRVAASPFVAEDLSAQVDAQVELYKSALMAGIGDSERFVKAELKRFGEASKSAFSDGFLSERERGQLLGLETELEILQTLYPTEFAALGGESLQAMIAAIKSGDLPGAMAAIAVEAAEGYKSVLFAALTATGESRTLADVIKSGGEGISDTAAWVKNVYQPALRSEMEEMHNLWKTGYEENRKVVDEELRRIKELHEDHSEWFNKWQQRLITLYEGGRLSTEQFLNIWAEMAGKADGKAAEAVESYKSATAMFYGEILADIDHWSAYVNEEGGFIGPTEKWVEREKEMLLRNRDIYEGLQEIVEMGGRVPLHIGAELQVPEIEPVKDVLEELASDPVQMPLILDAKQVRAEWDQLVQDIESLVVRMPVELDLKIDAYGIRDMIVEELRDLL